ncbi:MAG TPA: alpha/beta fold hydrolase, partial [Candidatus Limnocylindrales bacterium]|nr:alpha/beta fold hydrolase [Candidatus Limnocylindrales bacterium]
VVDRVATEIPGTLLLAEAFWLMEGFFVRTLGMHRVYNSAFMHMLRDEDNAGYRKVIRETLEFDPAILGRYVNFLTNPDEETAIEQFGTGDKYFGAATLLATLPGLPMIGHGEVEGFTEKYGMEYRRARLDETPNQGLTDYHEAQIAPLLRERRRFAGSTDFRLYDVVADDGAVNEDVYAFSNGRGADRSLVVYHNRFASAGGRIHESVAFAEKGPDGSKSLRRESLADALGLEGSADGWLRFRDRRSGREGLVAVGEIRSRGFPIHLEAYGCLVLDDLREVASTAESPWTDLAAEHGGHGVPSHDEALARLAAGRRRAAAVTRAADPDRPLASHEPRLEHRLQLDDGRVLAVAEWGDPDGTPVLLLHGRPGSRLLAPDPATTEALGVRLITFDRPGYGDSEPLPGRTLADGGDDVAEVAVRLGLGAIHVVGWSSGGPFALAAATRHPDLVRSVALVASDAVPSDLPTVEWASGPEALAIAEAARAGDPTARDRAVSRLAWFADAPTGFIDRQAADDAATGATDPDARLRARPEVFEGLRAHFAEAGRTGAAGFADDWLAWLRPWGIDLEAIKAPIDIWWGEEDGLTSRVHLDALARRLPGARVHIVPDAGHSITFSAWRQILDSLLGSAAPATSADGRS